MKTCFKTISSIHVKMMHNSAKMVVTGILRILELIRLQMERHIHIQAHIKRAAELMDAYKVVLFVS